jgi:hypothetical protein
VSHGVARWVAGAEQGGHIKSGGGGGGGGVVEGEVGLWKEGFEVGL